MWCFTCYAAVKFTEKRRIGKIQFIGNLIDRFVTVAE